MLNLDLWKLLLDLKSITSDILRYIFEPAEWIRYIAIYFNLPSEYDTWPADKPPIYLQKSFISSGLTPPKLGNYWEIHPLGLEISLDPRRNLPHFDGARIQYLPTYLPAAYLAT